MQVGLILLILIASNMAVIGILECLKHYVVKNEYSLNGISTHSIVLTLTMAQMLLVVVLSGMVLNVIFESIISSIIGG